VRANRLARSSVSKRGNVNVRALHSWNVTPAEARDIQLALREKVEHRDRLSKVRVVAGADAAFIEPERRSWERGSGRAIAAVVVYRFPEMVELERVAVQCPLTFPYIPGLLSFREIPVLAEAFKQVRNDPDVIFCDGQGYAHPRRFGLACHLGVLLDRPCIGCAKSRLIGSYREPGRRRGCWSALRDISGGRRETIGAVLRTADGVRPIFVSQGHRVSLRKAIRLVLAVCDGRRIPRPTRDADHLAGAAKRGQIPGYDARKGNGATALS
jgi:deoxyribonuclease V